MRNGNQQQGEEKMKRRIQEKRIKDRARKLYGAMMNYEAGSDWHKEAVREFHCFLETLELVFTKESVESLKNDVENARRNAR